MVDVPVQGSVQVRDRRGDPDGGLSRDVRCVQCGTNGVLEQVRAARGVDRGVRPGERVDEQEPGDDRAEHVELAVDRVVGAHQARLAQQPEVLPRDPIASLAERAQRGRGLVGKAAEDLPVAEVQRPRDGIGRQIEIQRTHHPARQHLCRIGREPVDHRGDDPVVGPHQDGQEQHHLLTR